jgi:hypothetical protein
MKAPDRVKFAALMSGLAMSFRQEIGEPLLTAWWLGLSDLDYPDLEDAVMKGLRTCEFMPTVAKLRELAAGKPCEFHRRRDSAGKRAPKHMFSFECVECRRSAR